MFSFILFCFQMGEGRACLKAREAINGKGVVEDARETDKILLKVF